VSQRSVGRAVLEKVWLPLVAVVVVAVGAVCMWKVHQMSAPGPVIAVNGPQAPEEFTPKQLTYELFGNIGEGGMLDYVDIDGHPLDFTTGTRLSQNRGIVATAAPLHDSVLEAIRAVCG